jgi:hypothetical protein
MELSATETERRHPADSIRFSAPVLSDDTITFKVQRGPVIDDVSFSIPPGFRVHPDCMAASLATFCGTSFHQIEFAFPVSEKLRTAIASWSGATVIAEGSTEPRQRGTRTALNFSGGFDSLAAYYLAPAEQLRCAIDFGGWFKRERQFFETQKPDIICSTDFRSKGYDRQSWMFMAAPSILLADYLDLEAIGFGTNFESSRWHYHSKLDASPRGAGNALFAGVGLHDATLTRGLTGFGITKVLCHFAPDLIPLSLKSLAPEGSIKRMRKTMVYESTRHVLGGAPPALEAAPHPAKRYKLGENYTEDVLALILAKLHGSRPVSRWMEGLETVDEDELAGVDVSWAFKFNPIFEQYIPSPLRTTVMQRLAEAQVETFCEGDWDHYRAFRQILERFHKFPVQ